MSERRVGVIACVLLSAVISVPLVSLPAQAPNRRPAGSSPAQHPNIVVIALDDVGFSDLGAFGSEIATPHFDSIAKRGLRYVRFDTNAICSATRAALLTGRNAQTIRMTALPSDRPTPDPNDQSAYKGELPPNLEFVSEALKGAGYATMAIGKWHLSPQYDFGGPGSNASFPLQRGFDYFYGFKMGWTDQYHPQLFEGNAPVATPERNDYQLSADLIDHAINAIQSSQQSAQGKPLFLYVGMPVAHAPTQVSKAYVDKYVPIYEQGWDRIREARFARQKAMGLVAANTTLTVREPGDPAWSTLTPSQRRVYSRFMAAYAGFLQYGDEQIGRLFDYLKKTGLEENTLVVLLSDNGAASETKTGGFRVPYGDKSTLEREHAFRWCCGHSN